MRRSALALLLAAGASWGCGGGRAEAPKPPAARAKGPLREEGAARLPLPAAPTAPLAESRLPVDLATALRIAAADSLEIARAKARHAAAKARRAARGGAFLPSAGVGAGTGEVDGRVQGSFGDQKEVQYRTSTADGILRWTLNPGEALFDWIAASRIEEAQGFSAEATRQRTLVEAAGGYHGLVRAQASAVSRGERLDLARRRLAIARAGAESGLSPASEVARKEAEVREREQESRLADQEFRTLSTRLAEILRLDPSVTLYPMEEASRERTLVDPLLSLADLARIREERNPSLREARKRVEAAAAAKKAAFWSILSPTVAAGALFGGVGEDFGSMHGRSLWGASAGWMLSPWKFGELEVAGAHMDLAEIDERSVALRTHGALARAYEASRSARERSRTALAELAAAEAVLRAAAARREAGLAAEGEVIPAKEAAAAARLRVASAIADYNRAQAELLAEVGEVDPEALERQGPGARD